jgi:lincosamide nucleotidyltransferase A/C/D/E
MTMAAGATLDVLDALDAAGVFAVVDGGWGIDALVGRQRRPHDDLDLIATEASLDAIRAALRPLGFDVSQSSRGQATVTACDGRVVDLHLLDDAGVQHGPDGEQWHHPPRMLEGSGVIARRAVRCLTAEAHVHMHLDYEHDAGDHADLVALRAATGVGLPLPFADGADVVYRDANELDAMAIAEVHVRSVLSAYAAIFPPHLPRPDRLELWDSWSTRLTAPHTWTGLLTVGGAVGGVVNMRPWPANHVAIGLGARTAQINAFYVHPMLWGRRFGETLFNQALARAHADHDDVRLWVLAGNTRAQRYYEQLGWRRDGVVQEVAPGISEERWCLGDAAGRG